MDCRTRAGNPASLATGHVLGMPELARSGLSESWMLKILGDRHWRLIAGAAGQSKASFRDRSGRDVYAAFCCLSVTAENFDLPDLDDRLDIHSDLFRISPARLASSHVLRIGFQEIARVCLVSAFIARTKQGENRSVARVDFPGLPVLAAPPEDLAFPQAAARLARSGADGHLGLRMPESLPGEPDDIFHPVPSLDFNRAGLLYFPSFVAAAERAVAARFGEKAHEFVLARRDVLFAGNVDLNEPISVFITDFRREGDGTKAAVALTGGDSRPLCQVFCEYRKTVAR